MSPLVEEQLASARRHFNGRIYVLKDLEDTAIVVLWPDGWWLPDPLRDAEEAPDGDWVRMTQPFLMVIDPARSNGGTAQ